MAHDAPSEAQVAQHFRIARTSQRRHLGFKFEAMWMRHAGIEETIEKKNSKFARAL